MIHFAHPIWLIIGFLAVCLVTWFFYLQSQRRQQKLRRFAAPQLVAKLTANVSYPRRRFKYALQILAIFSLFLALARPQYGDQWVEVKRKGIDLLFALDTSKSMLTEDIKPNRLQRAKLAILDFVDQLEGDRVGLLPFAGSAYLMCPLTLDYQAFGESLEAITTSIIPKGGTDLGTMIHSGAIALHNSANHKILIILSDGENLQGDALQAARETAKQGLTIYTIGVGTSKGDLIPLPKEDGGGFQKDAKGNFVTSRLEESGLQKIAAAGHGLYAPLGPAGEGLLTIYQQKLSQIPKEELLERRQKIPIERFSWPLSFSAVLLFIEFLLVDSKTKPLWRHIWPLSRRRSAILALFLGLLFFALQQPVLASPGEKAFTKGDYQQAEKYYLDRLQQQPDDVRLQYNYGSAAYKNGKYEEAVEAFGKSLHSDDPTLQEKSYYNQGNSYSQLGEQQAQGDSRQAISLWQQAVTAFEGALSLNPKNEDAQHNLRLVRKKHQQQQQQQQQQQNENQQDQNSKQKNSAAEKQQQSGGQDKQSQATDNSSQQQPPAQEDNNQPSPQKDQNPADQSTPRQQSEDHKDAEPKPETAAAGQPGEMTRQEALQLLDGLKSEEGTLNFVPAKGNETTVSKDW